MIHFEERQWLAKNPIAAGALGAAALALAYTVRGWWGVIAPALLLAILSIRLRTRVFDDVLIVSYLPFWRRSLPLTEVTDVGEEDYVWWHYGGWGIRFGRGAIAYTVWGKKAVRLGVRGKRDLVIGSRRPKQLVRALSVTAGHARGSMPPKGGLISLAVAAAVLFAGCAAGLEPIPPATTVGPTGAATNHVVVWVDGAGLEQPRPVDIRVFHEGQIVEVIAHEVRNGERAVAAYRMPPGTVVVDIIEQASVQDRLQVPWDLCAGQRMDIVAHVAVASEGGDGGIRLTRGCQTP